jgi:predicted transcriptional regulator
MNNREVPGDVGRHLVARIVSSYVKHNRVAADELQTMIASVHHIFLFRLVSQILSGPYRES